MSVKIAVAIVLLLAVPSAASAERKRPIEKFRPVQPKPALPGLMTGVSPILFSPWVKLCGRDKSDPSAPTICLTMREARRETGSFIAGAALIDGVGERKILRITLPSSVRQSAGARIRRPRCSAQDALCGLQSEGLPRGFRGRYELYLEAQDGCAAAFARHRGGRARDQLSLAA
jgi:hypothetical protein